MSSVKPKAGRLGRHAGRHERSTHPRGRETACGRAKAGVVELSGWRTYDTELTAT